MLMPKITLNVFNNHEPIFYNSATKISLENNLNSIIQRLHSKEIPEVEKDQWRKAKEETERTLNQLQGQNVFTNNIIPLQDQMKDHPEIKKLVDELKSIEKPREKQMIAIANFFARG
jgi:hypothetical protein